MLGWVNEVDIKTGPLGLAQPQYVNTKTNKQKILLLCPAAEVMLEVMPEVMSAGTALIKWSEVFFIIVY